MRTARLNRLERSESTGRPFSHPPRLLPVAPLALLVAALVVRRGDGAAAAWNACW